MARTDICESDREELAQFIGAQWRGECIISRGEQFRPHSEQGFIERRNGRIVAALTYRMDGSQMHILTLNSTIRGEGIGSSLMLQAMHVARQSGITLIWLTTTNDNLGAIGFYQRLGFRMSAVRLGAVDEARKQLPNIPVVGERGVAVHDEIVMELHLQPYLDPSI